MRAQRQENNNLQDDKKFQDRYTLIREIGKCAFEFIFEAEDNRKEKVAIKIINKEEIKTL